MLDTTKCVINGLNQSKYLRNRDRVLMSVRDVDSGNCNNIRTISGKMDVIDELATTNKVKNLHVFSKNYRKLRWRRFWFISLPAILVALSIGSFLPPKKIPVKKNIPTYEKTTTLYNSNYGETTTKEVGYVIDRDFSSYELSGDKTAFSYKGIYDSVRLQVYNQDDYLNALVTITADDLLNVNQVYSGDYYDFNDYSDLEFRDVEHEYDALYDKLIQILKDSSVINEKNLEILEKLNEDEKKTIVIEVNKYVGLGNKRISLKKSKGFTRIILIILLVVSLVASGFYYDAKKKDAFYFRILDYINGNLIEKDKQVVNLFYEALKYKEAYLAAERERLLLLDEEIKRNVVPADQGKLLTKYEKKVIKLARKMNERDR